MNVLARCPHCKSPNISLVRPVDSCSLLGLAYDLTEMVCEDCTNKFYIETTYKVDTVEVRKTRD